MTNQYYLSYKPEGLQRSSSSALLPVMIKLKDSNRHFQYKPKDWNDRRKMMIGTSIT